MIGRCWWCSDCSSFARYVDGAAGCTPRDRPGVAARPGRAATAALTLPWYLPNRQATFDYIRSTTSGPLSEGAGPEDPLTLHNMATFVVTVVNQQVGLVLAAAGVVVALVTLPCCVERKPPRRPRATSSSPRSPRDLGADPLLLLLTGHNQDVRLMAPAVAAFSILVGGGLGAVRPTWLRAGLATVVIATLAFQALDPRCRWLRTRCPRKPALARRARPCRSRSAGPPPWLRAATAARPRNADLSLPRAAVDRGRRRHSAHRLPARSASGGQREHVRLPDHGQRRPVQPGRGTPRPEPSPASRTARNCDFAL